MTASTRYGSNHSMVIFTVVRFQSAWSGARASLRYRAYWTSNHCGPCTPTFDAPAARKNRW